MTALASWSAHEVDLGPQVLPRSLSAISSAVHPSTSLDIAFRLPLHPPVNAIFVTLSSSSISKSILTEHVPYVFRSYVSRHGGCRCVKSDFFSASFNDLHVFPTLPFLRKLPRNIAFILNLQCCILHFILDKTGVKTLVCRSYYTISCGQVNRLCPYFVFFSKDFFLLWSVFFDIYFQNVY